MNRRKLFGLGLGALVAPVLPVLAPMPAFARGGVMPNVGTALIGETIDASRFVSGTITAGKIQAGSILASKLNLSPAIYPGRIADLMADLPPRLGTQPGETASEAVCAVPSNEFSDVTEAAEPTAGRGDLS